MVKYKTLWKWHSWLGLYTGIFIAFLSITGAAAVFKSEIDKIFNPNFFSVEIKGSHLSYDSLYQKLYQQVKPGLQVFRIHIPQDKKDPFYLSAYRQPAETDMGMLNKMLSYEYKQYFMNPYTGEFLGNRDYYKSLAYFLRNVHVRFYDNFYGRLAAGIFSVALLVSIVIGFIIYGNFIRNKLALSIRKKNFRQIWADWHKLIGILALFFNLVIALTGIWLGMQSYLMKGFNIKNPGSGNFEKTISREQDIQNQYLRIDEVLQKSHEIFPELKIVAIAPSLDGRNVLEIIGNVPGRVYEREREKIWFDKTSLQLKSVFNISEQDTSTKLYLVQEPLHFGDYGGIAMKVLYCIFGLTTGFLSITGYYIYLKRKNPKRPNRAKKIIIKYLYLFAVMIILLFLAHQSFGVIVTGVFYAAILYLLLLALFIFWIVKKLRKAKS